MVKERTCRVKLLLLSRLKVCRATEFADSGGKKRRAFDVYV